MPALACSVKNKHNTPPNITISIASCPSDLNQTDSDLPGFDHPPGMSSSKVTKCPIAANPERTTAGTANQLPTDRAPSKNATTNPKPDTRKTPMPMTPSLITAHSSFRLHPWGHNRSALMSSTAEIAFPAWPTKRTKSSARTWSAQEPVPHQLRQQPPQNRSRNACPPRP